MNTKEFWNQEDWETLNKLLYGENLDDPKIPKVGASEIIKIIEEEEEGFVRAFLGNNQKMMANQIEIGAITLDMINDLILAEGSEEAKIHYKIGELYGFVKIMSRIVPYILEHREALRRFNELQKKFPYAKDIILGIGSSIEFEDLIKKFKKNDEEEIKKSTLELIKYGFIAQHKYGIYHTLFFSDQGWQVFDHYTKNPDEEFFISY